MSSVLASVVLWLSLGLVLEVPGTLQEVALASNATLLRCGARSLHAEFPLIREHTVTVRDKAGLSHPLQNDTDCGIWVSWRPDGSMVIGADYSGCYVSEQDEEYVMTLDSEALSIEHNSSRQQLKCPVLFAMDAPRPDACAAIARVDRLSCGSLPITQAVCQALECCYDPTDSSKPCYFGKPVTGQCSADGQATIAISADVTVPSLNLANVRLLTVSSACTGLRSFQSEAFLVYQFPLSCGGVRQVMGDTTIYENRLEASHTVVTWGRASISRDSTFRLTVRCTFTSSSSSIPLQVEVFTLPPPLPVSSPGPLVLEMRIATDGLYGSYYTASQYPVVKILRDPVFVEVRILQRTDPNLMLVLNQCWATPSSDPMQQPQWPILVNRCPFPGDNYQTLLVPVGSATSGLQFPSHYQRFAVSTFTFVDSAQQNLRGQIFFRCSASVCVPSSLESCSASCSIRGKRMVKDFNTEHLALVSAERPVYFDILEEDGGLALAGSRSSVESLVPGWAIAVVLAVGFLMFLALGGLAVARLYHNRKCGVASVKA
ncbi:zona pellucida sperm-binding protein 4-like [Ambystoma mexicanum]|uniref:zona pellucida sperm-binding protein 4-like n=1 Tax=Ambystoma mexicanum TaxID=8296 RepID=UPI0037E76F24